MFFLLYWIQLILYRSLIYFHHFILAIYYWRRPKAVPPINNPILLKSAKNLAEDIRTGKLKSKEIVQAYIDRIQQVDKLVNAVVQNRFEEALREAKQVDKLIESGNFSRQQLEYDKPLLGVPLTVKILIKVEGFSFTAGNKILRDVVAQEDALCISLLKNAGAIIIATTNSPEFGLSLETHNLLYGRTRNPYDTRRTPGGSSGGESALLAAGASAIGMGNDMVGSVRIPAHFSGLYAHKPSRDLIANEGTFPLTLRNSPELSSFIATGPLCRFAEDLDIMMKILTKENKNGVNFYKKVDFKKLKIIYCTSIKDPRALPVDKEIVEGVHRAISYFNNSYGVAAQELNSSRFNRINDICFHLLHTPIIDIAYSFEAESSIKFNTFTEVCKFLVGSSNFNLSTVITLNLLRFPLIVRVNSIPFYQDLLKQLTEEFDNLLDDNTVFLCPTFPITAPYHTEMMTALTMSTCYTSLCNFTGMPATALPMGFNRNGMPHGMQVIAKRNNDPLTIACAIELSKVFGGWIPPGNVKKHVNGVSPKLQVV